MPASPAEIDAILNRLRGTAAPAFDAQVALYNGDPLSGGTELSGNGYTRYDPADGDWTAPADGTPNGRMIENSGEWLFGVASADWTAANYWAVVDGTGAVRYSNQILNGGSPTSITVTSGNRARIPAGSIRIRIGA